MNTSEITSKVNQYRIDNGKDPLLASDQLTSAAQAKADHMCLHDYFSHDLPDGTSYEYFIEQTGYDYEKVGENLAHKFKDSDGVVKGWSDSPGHKSNMLGDYTESGVAVVECQNYMGSQSTIVVQEFGRPVDQSSMYLVVWGLLWMIFLIAVLLKILTKKS